MQKIYDVVIIGSGPSGLTAAIYTTRANLDTLLFAGEKWGGQLMLTTEVENFPGFPKGIQGPELMLNMRQQVERLGASIVDKFVTNISIQKNIFLITDGSGETVTSRAIILAMGADTQWLSVPGEERLIGRGISSCAPCDAAFFRNKRVIVVGGGDSAMEEALFLSKFASEITVVHRRDSFRASKIMQDRVLANEKIKVFWNTQILEVKGDQTLNEVVFRTDKEAFDLHKTEMLPRVSGTVIEEDLEHVTWHGAIDGIFVAIGHKPNSGFLNNLVMVDDKGYILKASALGLPSSSNPIKLLNSEEQKQLDVESLLTHYPSLTTQEGIFVAGDVHDHHYRQAITAAAYGCMAAMDVERWLELVKK